MSLFQFDLADASFQRKIANQLSVSAFSISLGPIKALIDALEAIIRALLKLSESLVHAMFKPLQAIIHPLFELLEALVHAFFQCSHVLLQRFEVRNNQVLKHITNIRKQRS